MIILVWGPTSAASAAALTAGGMVVITGGAGSVGSICELHAPMHASITINPGNPDPR
jgi:hypothetical protein